MSYDPRPLDTSSIKLDPSLNALVEALAENVHDTWARGRMDQGWTYGPARDDAAKKHPCLVPYADLPESEKAYDRNTALETLRFVTARGYQISSTKRDVFLCYSRTDAETACTFVRDLKARGVECWLDIRDLLPGDDYNAQVKRAVEDSELVIFLCSEASLKSTWCEAEVNYATTIGKRVVPVCLSRDVMMKLWDELRGIQVVNWHDNRDEAIKTIMKLLGRGSPAAPDLFVSYSHFDAELAERVVHELEGSGIKCWIAPRDVEGGKEYDVAVEEALQAVATVAFLCSENSLKSKYCKNEIRIAFDQSKRIIPIMVDTPALLPGWSLYLGSSQWIDVSNFIDTSVENVVSAVKRIVEH